MKSLKLYGIVMAITAAAGLALAAWLTRAGDGGDSVADARLVADFEPASALVLACQEFAAQAPETFAELVEAVAGRVPVMLLVNSQKDFSEAEAALAKLNLKAGNVQFLQAAHDSCRIGHYGPLWIARGSDAQPPLPLAKGGNRELGKGEVVTGGQRDERGPALLTMPRHSTDSPGLQPGVHELAAQLRVPIIQAEVRLGGGNLLTNGRGLALTTLTTLDQNVDLGLDEHMIDDLLHRAGGITQPVFLEPLKGEPSGHVRMFAVFTSPDTVVVGKYRPQIDRQNADILDRNASLLREVEIEPGKPLKVERIPMPPPQPGIWPTYTFVVFVNGRLLVPTFPGMDGGVEEDAISVYERLLPGWEIVPIDARPLLGHSGALRSLVLPLGRLEKLPEFPPPRWGKQEQ